MSDKILNTLPDDILNKICNELNISSLKNIIICDKSLYNVINPILNDRILKVKKICVKFLELRKYNFYDLAELNRDGYLVSLKSIINNPKYFEGKTIQFVSRFSYEFENPTEGEICEGSVATNIHNDWYIDINGGNFNMYQPLLESFILKGSTRIIKENIYKTF